MGQKIILDSNILIYNANGFIELEQSFFSKNTIMISVITEMEVLGPSLTDIEEKKFKDLFNKIPIVQIEIAVVKKVIEIRKSFKIVLADAIIAARCVFREASLMIANTKDFINISNLKIINPLK